MGGRARYEARREGEGMDRGEEDRVSTGGGEGREEKGDGGEGLGREAHVLQYLHVYIGHIIGHRSHMYTYMYMCIST